MEVKVRAVASIESCFVSLPLFLIQTLESTRSDSLPLPPSLALELRDADRLWHVSWSGSASASSDIEIAQQYAHCIGLPNQTTVQVRAVPNLPKATLVTIEPHTEDDWEVLELNAEVAEASILSQVGLVHQGMRFPLWLHGRTIITFLVVSTFPKNQIVQLKPGTEVAVAPKRRKTNVDFSESSSISSSVAKALLRIQDPDSRFTHDFEADGVKMGVVITSAVYIHPDTAKHHGFNLLQCMVIEPRLAPKDSKTNHQTVKQKIRSSATKEINGGVPIDKLDHRQAIVRVLFSESVAKGHIMLSQSLCLYLRASRRSWIYLKRHDISPNKKISSFSLLPCQFKTLKKDVFDNNSSEVLVSQKSRQVKLDKIYSDTEMGVIDWSVHEKILPAIFNDSPDDNNDVTGHKSSKRLSSLLCSWCSAQLQAISSVGVDVNSLILGQKTLIHFKLKDHEFENIERLAKSCNGSLGSRNRTGELSVDILYILSISEESHSGENIAAYELSLTKTNSEQNNQRRFKLPVDKVQLDEGVYFDSVKERTYNKYLHSTVSSLEWMGTAASDITNRLTALLSPVSAKLFSSYSLPFPGHVLIYGPPGSGKTLLATAVSKSVSEHKDIFAHIVFVSCSGLASEKSPTIHQEISGYISEALDHAPSVIIFDDLDSILATSSDTEGSQPSLSLMALTEFLTDIMDEYEEKRRNSCGIGPVAFIASAQSLNSIPQSLSSSGRFDFHVQLPAPGAAERGALLKHEIQRRSLQCSDDVLLDIASKCDGYDAYDLEILVDRSVHAAISRFVSRDLDCGEQNKPTLVKDDFLQAMHEFLPVAMRDVTKIASQGSHRGWEDVGGLTEIRNAIKEMIEMPSRFPNVFSHAPLRLRSNLLLYGPPGCGKTHIVGAAAAACSLRFISVKGPELLNKYIGASEQAVRDIFTKASAAAPCLLFFDEFDSIAPKRGHDNTGVTDRVVNQFLTELDGVEVLTGVFVFAATSRPDLLDAALLRPGRLDRLLFCDFPSQHERLDILTVLSKQLQLTTDVDFDALARMTEGFSGADLQALLSDAQLAAVHEILSCEDSNKPVKVPVITDALLKSVASKARPSVSEAEKRRLYSIYSQFMDSKRSAAAQSKDVKGKRATLA
ncbi:Peroxin-1 [Heracleum sosnowskyi]|uniref:Peroxisomal ATPase PEX1 n=1 Tax=Heracleum sosnowskyi TaxID=360622 RepID=A0AAD8M5E8_9APIA|nr:Peroxin-1 [Heracleum sosnowskyi]